MIWYALRAFKKFLLRLGNKFQYRFQYGKDFCFLLICYLGLFPWEIGKWALAIGIKERLFKYLSFKEVI